MDFAGGGLGDACSPEYLDLLCETIERIATDAIFTCNFNKIRNQLLPIIKHINASDFARACGKVRKEDNSSIGDGNDGNDGNDELAILVAARLAHACSPLESREKKPLLLGAVRTYGDNYLAMQPKELLSHSLPIVRGQMARSMWEWEKCTTVPKPKDAIARRLPGLDYRSINYKLTTKSAQPREKSMLEKLIPNIVRSIHDSIETIAQLSASMESEKGKRSSSFRGWFKRLGWSKSKSKSKSSSSITSASATTPPPTSSDPDPNRKQITSNILKEAKNNTEELCYTIEVSLHLLRKHVSLVCATVEHSRLLNIVSSTVSKNYGILPSSLIKEGLCLLNELCSYLSRRVDDGGRGRGSRPDQHKEEEMKQHGVIMGRVLMHVRPHLLPLATTKEEEKEEERDQNESDDDGDDTDEEEAPVLEEYMFSSDMFTIATPTKRQNVVMSDEIMKKINDDPRMAGMGIGAIKDEKTGTIKLLRSPVKTRRRRKKRKEMEVEEEVEVEEDNRVEVVNEATQDKQGGQEGDMEEVVQEAEEEAKADAKAEAKADTKKKLKKSTVEETKEEKKLRRNKRSERRAKRRERRKERAASGLQAAAHRRLSLAVVTACGRHSVDPNGLVNDVCRLLLDSDTAVRSSALVCVQQMSDIDPTSPCVALGVMLQSARENSENGNAIAVLSAVATLGSHAAESCSVLIREMLVGDYTSTKKEKEKMNDGGAENGGAKDDKETTDDHSETSDTNSDNNSDNILQANVPLRYASLLALISMLRDDVAQVGFDATLVGILEMVLSEKNESPKIKSHALLTLSDLLGPAAIRFAQHFARYLPNHDQEMRRVALVAVQRLGPAAKRFYPLIVTRLEDDEFHLRNLAATALASTFPPVAASRLIVRKMRDGVSDGAGRPNKKLKPQVREVHVDALAKLLRGAHRKYAKEFLSDIVPWTDDPRSSNVRIGSLRILLNVFCAVDSDSRMIQPHGGMFIPRIHCGTESRPEIRIAGLALLKRCTDKNNVVKHMNKVCQCLGDPQSAVRDAAVDTVSAMYPAKRAHERELLDGILSEEERHEEARSVARKRERERRSWFRKRRGKHSGLIEKLRKRLRTEILVLHQEIRSLEERITGQMKKYQHYVELMRRERISRQYQQHNDEIALHDARTALVDSDASDSDEDQGPSASDVVQRMMQGEEEEKRRERERGMLLTDCRMVERELRASKDVSMKKLDGCHRELKIGEKKFEEGVHRLDLEIEDARKESLEWQSMIGEDLRVRKNKRITDIHFHERYRRTLVSFLSRHGETKRRERKERERHRSKHLPPLPSTPRLTNVWSDEVRLSTLHALRQCHTQWESTYYVEEIDIVLESGEPNTQIRGAAIELMTFVSSPDDAFRYGSHVLHSLQSQCSVLREGATSGARALGAVPLQQAAKFTRGFRGAFGPKMTKDGYVRDRGKFVKMESQDWLKPIYRNLGYQKRDTYVRPGMIREENDLLEIFKLMDADGNGLLDKSEVMAAVNGNTIARRMLSEHPTLKRVLRDDLWSEKVFAACDTDVSGSIDFDEFVQFVARAMGGADPIMSGVSIDLNRHLLLRAPPGPLPKEKEENEQFLVPFNPKEAKEKERLLKLQAKGIMKSSGGGKGVKGEKSSKAPTKRMTRVRRQAMDAVNTSASIIQGLVRGWRERRNMSNHLDNHFDNVVANHFEGLLRDLNDEGSATKGKEKKEMVAWIGEDPEAIEAANHAATSIQSSIRGYLARSGKKDEHLEAMVEKIMQELMEEEEEKEEAKKKE